MDFLAPIIFTSIVWIPALVALYWVIRLAVRHALEDAERSSRLDARRAAAREAERQAEDRRGSAAE